MNIEVTGRAIPRFPRREIAAFVRKVLRHVGVVRASMRASKGAPEARTTPISEVSIAFIDDHAMAALNKKFRGKNKTTDVLTFSGDSQFLGDIVISLDQAKRQAVDEKHSLATEVRYLLLHGMLHALGYDHETDDGEMNALELKVRSRVGL